MTDYTGYTYSLLIAGGGLAGYVTAGSVMSLVMGLVCGSLAALGARRLSLRADSYLLGLLVSLAMAGRFGQAYYKTGQVWPALVVTIASVLMVLRYLYAAKTVSIKQQRNKM